MKSSMGNILPSDISIRNDSPEEKQLEKITQKKDSRNESQNHCRENKNCLRNK